MARIEAMQPTGFRVPSDFHEDLEREADVKHGSNRSFGLVMATACLFIAGLGFWADTSHWPFWLVASIALATAACLKPAVLEPLNRFWFRLGIALHRVVNPFVMGFLFFVVITPVSLLMRLCGKRPLGLEFQRDATSYWVMRHKSELQPGPMAKQY
jgi:hypothetical protein